MHETSMTPAPRLPPRRRPHLPRLAPLLPQNESDRLTAFWRSAGGSIPDQRPVLDLSNETYWRCSSPSGSARPPSPRRLSCPRRRARRGRACVMPGTVAALPPTPSCRFRSACPSPMSCASISNTSMPPPSPPRPPTPRPRLSGGPDDRSPAIRESPAVARAESKKPTARSAAKSCRPAATRPSSYPPSRPRRTRSCAA